MIFIQHRVNSKNDLANVSVEFGVEMDLRCNPAIPGEMIVHHDPWANGDSFSDWLDEYAKRGIRGPLILNTKEDGLEERLIEMCASRGISNFFFLDTAFPTLVKWTLGRGEKRFAGRVSRYEPGTIYERFVGKMDWLWVDCFHGEPMDVAEIVGLKQNFKICLVSPELQGMPLAHLTRFRELAGIADAICTKYPGEWKSIIR